MRRISASSASLLALLLVAACADRVPDPVAVAGVPQAVNAGSFVQLDGTASHDPQDRSLAYSWVIVKRPVGSNAQLVDANTPTPSFLADKPGEYVIELTVSNSLFSTKSQVTVIVSTCKATAPVVGAIHSSKTTMNIGDTTQLTAEVSDGDNLAPCSQSQTFTYSWEVLRQPTGSTASLNNTHSETPSLTVDKAGDYVVRLTVTDSTGLSSEPKTLTVTAGNCGAAPAPSLSEVAVSITDPQPGGPANAGSPLHVGGSVLLTTTATEASACGVSAGTLALTWNLAQRPAGSAAALDTSTAGAATFVPDRNGHYRVTVVATDARGNQSAARAVDLDTTTCGENPIAAAVQDVAGAKPFDDHVLTAIHTSGASFFTDDDDPARCPARFAGRYTFTWSVPSSAPDSGFVFDTTNGPQVKLTPGGNGIYNVRLVVAGALQHADVLSQVFVSCPDVLPKTGTISLASSTPGYPAGTFFRDDTATLSAAPSSLCFSAGSTAFTFLWSLTPPEGSHSVLSSTTAATPALVADVSAGTWTASVTVLDKLGNRSLPATASFTSESCGINPVLASIGAPTRPSGSLAFDPYSLTASAHSDDDDLAKCPARFAQTYSIAWSVVSAPDRALTLLSPSSATGLAPNAATATTLRPGGNATYTITAHASGSKSGNTASPSRDIDVLCGDVTPTKVTNPSISAVMPPGGTDGFTRAIGQFFRDDAVTLSAAGSSTCFSPGNTSFTYAWTLSPVNPPALNGALTQTPSFTVNTPGGAYTATVVAKDSLQNASLAGQQTFTADTCGANAILAKITESTAGLPMDPWTLTASPATGTHFSDDSDPTKCPARFAPTYTFGWSSVDAPASAFSTAASNPSTFTPAQPKSYAIQLVVSGNGQSGNANATVDATCAAPSVDTPTVVQVNGTAPGTTIFVGDAVKVGTPATSACFASPTFTYAYTLQRDGATAPETFSPSDSAAQPSFTPQVYGASYAVSVTVGDGSGQTSSPGSLTIAVSSCGFSGPTVSFTATQHLESVQQKVGPDMSTVSLDLAQKSDATTTTVTIDVGGTPQAIEVPFYLATPVNVAVNAAASSCSSVTFNSAKLLDPDGNEVPTTDWTQPTSQSVSPDTELSFVFTPKIGDHLVGADTVPGHYMLALNLTFGGSNSSQTTNVNSSAVEVGGRCGLNAPFVDVSFDPTSPAARGTTISADASASSDADNDVLELFTSTSTSVGCGLNQSLTYSWSGLEPDATPLAFNPANAASTTFNLDQAGAYSLQLVVGDGTTSGANGDGTTTATFSYEATP